MQYYKAITPTPSPIHIRRGGRGKWGRVKHIFLRDFPHGWVRPSSEVASQAAGPIQELSPVARAQVTYTNNQIKRRPEEWDIPFFISRGSQHSAGRAIICRVFALHFWVCFIYSLRLSFTEIALEFCLRIVHFLHPLNSNFPFCNLLVRRGFVENRFDIIFIFFLEANIERGDTHAQDICGTKGMPLNEWGKIEAAGKVKNGKEGKILKGVEEAQKGFLKRHHFAKRNR